MSSELEQLRQEAEALKGQIRVNIKVDLNYSRFFFNFPRQGDNVFADAIGSLDHIYITDDCDALIRPTQSKPCCRSSLSFLTQLFQFMPF